MPAIVAFTLFEILFSSRGVSEVVWSGFEPLCTYIPVVIGLAYLWGLSQFYVLFVTYLFELDGSISITAKKILTLNVNSESQVRRKHWGKVTNIGSSLQTLETVNI